MKPSFLPALFLLLLGCNQPPERTTKAFPSGKWVDLTYAFDENTIFWPTAETFQLDTVFAGLTDSGYYYSAFQFCLAEHGGTHLDAPVHFAQGRWSVDEIPLERSIGEAVVIDVSERAADNRDYLVSVADVERWEEQHGPLPAGAIVLIRTGYGRFWPDPVAYLGTAERGPAAVAKLHFPGIHPALATWLVEQRDIKAIGLDTPSLDYGQSKLFESHRILNAENILGFENLANLDQLPPTGAYVMALPMKIKGGSGPFRIVALVPG